MIKMIGVIFVIVSCGVVGFKISVNYKREEKYMFDLILILEYMISELQYRLTPLPQLCRQVSRIFNNSLGNVFEKFSEELELQQYADPAECMSIVLKKTICIPPITRDQIVTLGFCVGQFDIEGQIKSIESVLKECERRLALLRNNRDNRLRSYQTLGLCAGAALAILFV